MEGSDFGRSAGRNCSHDTGRAARPNDGTPSASMAPTLGSGIAGIALAALEAELAYRGPERRSGPGAGLAKLLASVLDEVDYGLVLIAADGHVVHANHAARVELAGAKSLQLVGRRLAGRSAG